MIEASVGFEINNKLKLARMAEDQYLPLHCKECGKTEKTQILLSSFYPGKVLECNNCQGRIYIETEKYKEIVEWLKFHEKGVIHNCQKVKRPDSNI